MVDHTTGTETITGIVPTDEEIHTGLLMMVEEAEITIITTGETVDHCYNLLIISSTEEMTKHYR